MTTVRPATAIGVNCGITCVKPGRITPKLPANSEMPIKCTIGLVKLSLPGRGAASLRIFSMPKNFIQPANSNTTASNAWITHRKVFNFLPASLWIQRLDPEPQLLRVLRFGNIARRTPCRALGSLSVGRLSRKSWLAPKISGPEC